MHLYVYLNLFGIINNINGEDNYHLIKGELLMMKMKKTCDFIINFDK